MLLRSNVYACSIEINPLELRGKRHLALRYNANIMTPLGTSWGCSSRGLLLSQRGFIQTRWARRCARLHSPKRDHVAATRVTTDVDAFLRNHANGRAQSTNDGSVSSTHCVSPLLLQIARGTKLLLVVQLRSGVILLMGDPVQALERKNITPEPI